MTSATTQPMVPGYYVATNGNDEWSGTLPSPNSALTDGPFATLTKAQGAMQKNPSIKTTYIRAGKYSTANPITGGNAYCSYGVGTSMVSLSSSDSGETWSYYPPDGFNSAILDGGSTQGQSGQGSTQIGSSANGVWCAFGNWGATNITIIGLQFQNFSLSALWSGRGSNITFIYNIVHNQTSAIWDGAAVTTNCTPNSIIKNNYIYDVTFMGIGVWGDPNESECPNGMNDTVVSGNVIINSCTWPSPNNAQGNDQNGTDCGAIYIDSNDTSLTGVQLTNNYIRDVYASGIQYSQIPYSIGIYLDTATSGVTESGNIVTGIKTACFSVPGGHLAIDDIFTGNICDIGNSYNQQIVVYNGSSGSSFENNIIVSGDSGSGAGYASCPSCPNSTPIVPMTIENNDYYNYVGSEVDSGGSNDNAAGKDSNAIYKNPQISGWTPTIASGSPVWQSPVSFPGIKGGWGPPGFVIPETGTPPSWPH